MSTTCHKMQDLYVVIVDSNRPKLVATPIIPDIPYSVAMINHLEAYTTQERQRLEQLFTPNLVDPFVQVSSPEAFQLFSTDEKFSNYPLEDIAARYASALIAIDKKTQRHPMETRLKIHNALGAVYPRDDPWESIARQVQELEQDLDPETYKERMNEYFGRLINTIACATLTNINFACERFPGNMFMYTSPQFAQLVKQALKRQNAESVQNKTGIGLLHPLNRKQKKRNCWMKNIFRK